MVLNREITARIREVLEKHPEGISITDLVRSVDINRNTAGRYLESMLLSGQVEMRRFGMAKLYTLAQRLPVASVLSISSELVLQLDFGMRVLYANDPLLTFLGLPAKDLFGKNIEFTPFSIAFEDVFPDLLDRFRRGLRGEEWHGELPRPVRRRFFFCRIAPTVSAEGSKGISVLLEDITDQKRDEERIRTSEARLRNIFRVSPVGIGMVADRIFVEVNDRFCEMTGHSAAELVGKSARMLYPSDEAFDRVGTRYYSQIRQSGAGSLETQWVKKDGTVIDVLLNTIPLDPASISGGITFTALDITERKQAEQNLRQSEEKYRHVVEQSLQGLTIIQDNRHVYANAAMLEIVGYSYEEYMALSPEELLATTHPEDRDRVAVVMADNIGGKTLFGKAEFRIQRHDGTTRWVLAQGSRITFNAKPAVQVVFFDITDRRQAEDALRESEDRYRKLVEISPNAVLLHRDGKVIYANRALARILGTDTAEGFLGKNVMDLIHPADREAIRANIAKDLDGASSPFTELQMIRADGAPVYVEGQGIGITIEGKPAVLVAINDITGRRRTEQVQRESEAKYRSLAEASRDLIFLIGRDDRIEFVNSYAAGILGLPADLVIGQKNSSLFTGELGKRQAAVLRQVFETGTALHKEGAIEILGKLHWFDHYLMPITGPDGTVTSVLGVSRDISDRKETEDALRASEERYRALLGQMFDAAAVHRDGKLVSANGRAAQILGAASPQDLTGRPIFDLILPDSRNDLEERIATITADPSQPAPVLREQLVRADGTTVTVEVMAMQIIDNGLPAILVMFREVPDRP